MAKKIPTGQNDVERLLELLREMECQSSFRASKSTRANLRVPTPLPRESIRSRGAQWIAGQEHRAGDASLRVLRQLLPTLHALLGQVAGQREASVEIAALRVFCDWMLVPVYLVDAGLRVYFFNRAAAALGARHGLSVVDGKLALSERKVARRLRDTLADSVRIGNIDQTIHDFGVLPGGRMLQLRAATTTSNALAEMRWFVTLEDAVRDPLARWRACGLTEAESRIAALIAAGRRPQQTAAELGVSINTVRTHLKAIFAKLDVHTQSGLVRMDMDGVTRRQG